METDLVVSHLLQDQEPRDFEFPAEKWAAAMRAIHPSEFEKGGHRVLVPLISQGEAIGLITLGDRVAGTVFSVQDFDMLKCIGDHASASLRNLLLSQKLLQSKELEAFQTMAAFFVHDLKNAASTLNLMLQNLPLHFDDPEFRKDSLRGISKTVAHINGLISRLSLLRHEQGLMPVESDLNEVISKVLSNLGAGLASVPTTALTPLPRVMIDRDQIGKVITNLVLNAIDAVQADGHVQIATELKDNWAVLSIVDNGCGISSEFLRNDLFRPFRTTKKNGLGIGMFQSKMIVEAHGGRIAAVSEPSKGTTFQVYLPVVKDLK